MLFRSEEFGKKYAYDKVIMQAGGIGYGKLQDAQKHLPKKDDKIVVLGGDNYRIGMGGSAVSSVATGCIDGTVVADLSYEEEAYEGGPVADIPVAILPGSGKITLLQMDGDCSREDLKKALELATKVCLKIYEVQKQALKDKFKVGESK